MSEPHALKSITVGNLTLKKEPKYCNEIREWLKILNIPWAGEGLPAASLKALYHLLKPRRKQLSDTQKSELLHSQNNKCASCLAVLENPEFHHRIPLQNSVARQEFVAVCNECHSNFTINQGPSSSNVLESCFEKSVYQQYVESPKQKAIVLESFKHQDRGDPLLLDIIRSRRNALFECVFDIPIFCPLDLIEERDARCATTEYKLYDISYVKKM